MLRDLVPFVQFKKREQHAWRSASFSTVVGSACDFTKSNTPPWVFFKFFGETDTTDESETDLDEREIIEIMEIGV